MTSSLGLRPPDFAAAARLCRLDYQPRGSRQSVNDPIWRVMEPDLTDEQRVALVAELARIVENDRYPLSPRIRALKAILAKFRPEPIREPLPPVKRYEPPRAKAARRRRAGR